MNNRGVIAGVFALVLVVVLVIGIAGQEGDAEVTGVGSDLTTKPEIEISGGKAPTELVVDDIVEGDGEAIEAGEQGQWRYVGVLLRDGSEFDSSWSRGDEPTPFTIGVGDVIQGWDDGLVGMKEGGRRVLIIPSELAYGEAGSPPNIGPDETLAFVIDLVSIGEAETDGADAGAGAGQGAGGNG